MWSNEGITWENGLNILHSEWDATSSEMLESIVHRAMCQSQKKRETETPSSSSSGLMMNKPTRAAHSDYAAAAFSLNNSMDSCPSLKPNKTAFQDSAAWVENQDELGRERKAERVKSGNTSTTRRSRATSAHNQSERRRRDRINEKLKALQKLVPNAISKRDKASMLDEVIHYLKQLQSQLQLMATARRHFINSFGIMQHPLQIHMSLLPIPPMPPLHPHAPPPFAHPQAMNMNMNMNMQAYNKMAQLYLQQLNQTIQTTTSNQ